MNKIQRTSERKKALFLLNKAKKIRLKISSTKYLEVYCHKNNIDPITFKIENHNKLNFTKDLPNTIQKCK